MITTFNREHIRPHTKNIGIKGFRQNKSQIRSAYRKNHGAEGDKNGKHNVKVRLEFRNACGSEPAKCTDTVELCAEDDHDRNSNPCPCHQPVRGAYYYWLAQH